MKNIFRIITFIILTLIVIYTLFRNKKSIEFETSNAKQVIQTIPVRTVKVKRDIPVKIIKAAGSITANKESYIISTQAGEITDIRVKAGEYVEKGTIVAQVNDFYSRKEYDIAYQAYEQFKRDYERYKSLAETDAVTGQQLEQLKLQLDGAETRMTTLKKRLDETLIKSTLNGYINQVLVKTGGMVGQGTPVCEVVNIGGLSINTGLPVPDIGYIRKGTPAKIGLQIGDVHKLDATVVSCGVKPDFSGKYPLILEFNTPAKNMLAGTVVDIDFSIPGDSAYIIPDNSIVQYQNKEGVFILRNNQAFFTPLEIESRYDGIIAVKSGLSEGMEVISEGSTFLSDSARVRVISQ